MTEWTSDSWRAKTARHQPAYPDAEALAEATGELAACGGMLAIAAWLPWLVGALGLALALGMIWVLLKVFRRKRSGPEGETPQ